MGFKKGAYVLALIATSAKAFNCDINSLEAFLPSNATVLAADRVEKGGNYSEGSADIAFPQPATDLPDLCAVTVKAPSSDSSSFRFGLFLPDEWSGQRFLATGLGMFAGGIDWQTMGAGVKYGIATISSDTGHNSTGPDTSWAYNNPEAREDWGHRALHLSIGLAKDIVKGYYSQDINYSYYAGCSTGGRQGLKTVERYPEDVDGALVGAPAWWVEHLPSSEIRRGINNLPTNASHHIPQSLLSVIAKEVINQCDEIDGVKDGIISAPYDCFFQPENMLCGPISNTSECLNGDQIETLYKIHSDWLDTNDTFVFPGFNLGTEDQLMLDQNGEASKYSVEYIRNFVRNDKNWDWRNFSYESDTKLADELRPGNATPDKFDLSDFRERGGKLIHYHGLADPLIPTRLSNYFHDKLLRTMVPKGVDVNDFYRYLTVPGMNHCQGSTQGAPYVINSINQAESLSNTPMGLTAENDTFLALIDWVENNKTTDSIIATTYTNDDPQQGVDKQRPICLYPTIPKYNGGDINSADSWSCN